MSRTLLSSKRFWCVFMCLRSLHWRVPLLIHFRVNGADHQTNQRSLSTWIMRWKHAQVCVKACDLVIKWIKHLYLIRSLYIIHRHCLVQRKADPQFSTHTKTLIIHMSEINGQLFCKQMCNYATYSLSKHSRKTGSTSSKFLCKGPGFGQTLRK